MKIAIINGPNLNLIGRREPDIYGTKSFDDFYKELVSEFPSVKFSYYQSNVEGELINILQDYGFTHDGIVFNPGGYAHTSIAIADCIAAIQAPVVEVHISNIFSREDFRKHSHVSRKAKGVISGLGLWGYGAAVMYLIDHYKPS